MIYLYVFFIVYGCLEASKYKQRSKDGGARYAVRIMYGPYDYVRETF